MILRLLRWFSGYAKFTAKGKFPERLLNMTMKNGVQLWGMRSDSSSLTAYVAAREYKFLRPFAKRCELTLKCTKKGGLPFIISQYKIRSGLLVGAILYIAISIILSGYIWNININTSGSINEYELREELRSLGLYEGAKISDINIQDIEQQATIDMDNIAWISINITGTLVNIEISPRIDKKTPTDKTPSNIIASSDGVITGIEAGEGKPSVKIGEAVVKGQMLVSGILEYDVGGFKLKHSDAKIYAQTKKTLSVSVPLEETVLKKNDFNTYKKSLSLLWVSFPISIYGTPDGYISTQIKNENVELFGTQLPIKITTENYNIYENIKVKRTEKQARTLAEKQLSLLETFSLNNAKSYTKKYTQKISNGKLILTGTYTCTEDIAIQQEIKIDGSITEENINKSSEK